MRCGRFLNASESLCEKGVRAAVKSYRDRMKEFAHYNIGNMELWYNTISEKDIFKTLTPSARKGLQKITAKARERTHMQVLGKMTDLVGDKFRLRINAHFIVRETHNQLGLPIEEALQSVLESYFSSLADDRKNLLQHYHITDVARKIVGVGSVGTRCCLIFLTGKSSNDPLFLQVKKRSARC